MVQYFKAACTFSKNYKSVSNWLTGAIKSHLNNENISITALGLSPG